VFSLCETLLLLEDYDRYSPGQKKKNAFMTDERNLEVVKVFGENCGVDGKCSN
jgi:hypothetical protein